MTPGRPPARLRAARQSPPASRRCSSASSRRFCWRRRMPSEARPGSSSGGRRARRAGTAARRRRPRSRAGSGSCAGRRRSSAGAPEPAASRGAARRPWRRSRRGRRRCSWSCGEQDRRLGQRVLGLGQADPVEGLGRGDGDLQGARIGQADVLRGGDDQPPGDEPGILAGGDHRRQPVQGGVRVVAADALDEGADGVVVAVAGAVVGSTRCWAAASTSASRGATRPSASRDASSASAIGRRPRGR
jgi:hypothetical protein